MHLGKYIPFGQRIKAFGRWPLLKGPSIPERLRMSFEELGPSFIKLAQILSTRPDLITARYADEFRKLQDKVPPFSTETARAIVEEETGAPISRIFRRFDAVPVAAASIAQVHSAILHDGNSVVVKIQRPGIREILEVDISLLETIARLMEENIEESKLFNPTGIVREFRRTVMRELDFQEEARNCCRFRKNFADNPDVFFPLVYTDFSTSRVLVMDRIEGVRIDDVKGLKEMGLDRKEMARKGVDAYMKMVFEDGFFHADPHPGNIFAMAAGRVGFTDFGIVGRITDEMKQSLVNIFLALTTHDYDRLIDQYLELGVVPADMDIDVFRYEFKADLVDVLEPMYGLTLKEINFAEYLQNMLHVGMKHNLRVPSELLLINKAFIILEDLGRRLDPDFNFIEVAEPYASKLVREKASPTKVLERISREVNEVGEFVYLFPRQMKKIMRKVIRDDLHLKMSHIGLDRFIKDMDRSSNRIAFAMVVSAITVSSAIMHAAGVGPTIFGLSSLGIITFVGAFVLGIWLLISIVRSGRL